MSKRVLVIGDEPREFAALAAALAPLGRGFEPVCAVSIHAALAHLEQEVPDIVILDAESADVGGLRTLAHLRSHPVGLRIPIVVVTASKEREEHLANLEAGAADVLTKPIDAPIFRARLRALLSLHAATDTLRRTNDELQTRNEALERLQQEQRDLVAFIVHDLKTPLAVVWSNVDFAQEQIRASPVPLRDALHEAARATRRLRSMIDDLLTMSRLEDSEFPVRLESISVPDLLLEVVREYTQIADDKHVELLPPSEARGRVRADRTLLQRVLENILDNSLRHTPAHGRVALDACVEHDVVIAVSNSGPSIPAAERGRIFEKFARLDKHAVVRGHAGLGLYFCKRAVEALGGNIEVTETPEWPTSFVMHLPAA
jgi:two-component system sensor histidine kinase/response regulator